MVPRLAGVAGPRRGGNRSGKSGCVRRRVPSRAGAAGRGACGQPPWRLGISLRLSSGALGDSTGCRGGVLSRSGVWAFWGQTSLGSACGQAPRQPGPGSWTSLGAYSGGAFHRLAGARRTAYGTSETVPGAAPWSARHSSVRGAVPRRIGCVRLSLGRPGSVPGAGGASAERSGSGRGMGGEALETLVPFARRAGVAVTGRERLARVASRLAFLWVTEDASPRTVREVRARFTCPVVRLMTAADVGRLLGYRGTRVVGFFRSPLAASLYEACRGRGIAGGERP